MTISKGASDGHRYYLERRFSLAALCRAMEVSQSGYRAWATRKPSARAQTNAKLTEQLRHLFVQRRKTYGSVRLTDDLHDLGEKISKNRVARWMRVAGLKVVAAKRFTVTTDSKHAFPVSENVLNREFSCETPNAKWSADITYIWTGEGWIYLAVLLDLFSRRVVGWATGARLDRSLVLSALGQAKQQRCPPAGLVCHSDRGSQYASGDYQTQLKESGIVCSMSRKGNCWDNAPTESFFATLKKELVHRCRFACRAAAHSALFEWIEVWYNRQRKHSTLGYLSPVTFEEVYRSGQRELSNPLSSLVRQAVA
jgi:putative transposase